MIRTNPYEQAFAAFLRRRQVGFVCIDETRRQELDQSVVKSLDFVVFRAASSPLAVDVKGRRFPGGPPGKPVLSWQNWATADDIDALTRWAEHLGPGSRGLLAFVYHIRPGYRLAPETPDLFRYRDRTFLIRAVDVAEYRDRMLPRSPRWQTVHLRTHDFQELVRPLSHYLQPDRDGMERPTRPTA